MRRLTTKGVTPNAAATSSTDLPWALSLAKAMYSSAGCSAFDHDQVLQDATVLDRGREFGDAQPGLGVGRSRLIGLGENELVERDGGAGRRRDDCVDFGFGAFHLRLLKKGNGTRPVRVHAFRISSTRDSSSALAEGSMRSAERCRQVALDLREQQRDRCVEGGVAHRAMSETRRRMPRKQSP